jgi:hypothetical protein
LVKIYKKHSTMKKITLLAIAALAISFASCKKDYTCTCTTSYTGGGSSTSTTIHKGLKKKQAQAACANTESKDESGVTESTSTCALS